MEEDGFTLNRIVKLVTIGGSLAVLPLFANLKTLQPPWPDGLEVASSCVIFLTAVMATQWGPQVGATTRRRLLWSAVAATVIGFAAYLLLTSLFVAPVLGRREILGFWCTPPVARSYANCPFLTEADLGEDSYMIANFYSPVSQTLSRLALVTSWFAFLIGLITVISWATIWRSAPPAKRPRKRAGRAPKNGA